MTSNTIEFLIGCVWLLYSLGFLWLASGTFRLARSIDGSIWKWPVAGRYLLAGLSLGFAAVSLDVVRLRFEPDFMESIWTSEGPGAANTWTVLVIRAIPLIFLFWVAWRIRNGGIVQGNQSSLPDVKVWDGVERRSGIERRQHVRREDDRREPA